MVRLAHLLTGSNEAAEDRPRPDPEAVDAETQDLLDALAGLAPG
jgi:hypothetical protein